MEGHATARSVINQGNGFPLNQNRNNNRRRGRGNNRGGPGGGIQGNRIDSRARGNAPQMLEKYRKLAHDASLNGDRVQTEYYLQFADHYFRVVADSRSQNQNDQRPRRDEREQSSSYDNDGYESDDRDEREDEAPQTQPARTRSERDEGDAAPVEGSRASEGEEIDGSGNGDNPFVRGNQERAKPRSGPRSEPRPRRSREARPTGDNGAAPEGQAREPEQKDRAPDKKARAEKKAAGNEDASFDPGLLPPSIAREEDAKPRPTRSRRRARPAEDSDDEALEAVS